MKLKIFLFPASLMILIIASIWFVWPAWFDENDGIMKRKAEVAEKSERLQAIKSKKANIMNLQNSLELNSADEKVVKDYLVEEKKEESIINAVSYLANSNSLALVGLNVEDEPKVNTKKPEEEMLGIKGGTVEIVTGSEPKKEKKTVAKGIKVTASVLGEYDKIKSFMDDIHRTNLINNAYSVKISSEKEVAEIEEGEGDIDQGSQNSLLGEIEIYYGYMPKVKLAIDDDLSNPIFSQQSFDFTTTDKIKALINGKAPEVTVGEVGKINPFISE